MRFSSFGPFLNGHESRAEDDNNIDLGSGYMEMPDLFEETDFDFSGGLDIDELPLKGNPTEHLPVDDGRTLNWLYSYDTTDCQFFDLWTSNKRATRFCGCGKCLVESALWKVLHVSIRGG